MVAQFVDISSFQGPIDFVANRAWAASFDGIARIAMKATEGVGFVDPRFRANRSAALAAGFDVLIMYHFARPDLGNSDIAEANFMQSVVGPIRNSDMIILDYEVQSPLATAQWALGWLVEFGPKYGKLPGIYASSAYILEKLQWPALEVFPLWLANWQFTPDERPACPPPWSSYEFVQYTDRATIPGIPGVVDCNIYLGGTIPMPQSPQVPGGWSDDGHTLTAPNHIPVVLGFRDKVLNSNWSPDNWPMRAEYHADPVEQSHPSLGAGPAQEFRWDRLAGCASLGIYKTWLGQELYWYQQQHALLVAQVADLQEKLADLQPAALVAENAELKAQIAQAVKDLQP